MRCHQSVLGKSLVTDECEHHSEGRRISARPDDARFGKLGVNLVHALADQAKVPAPDTRQPYVASSQTPSIIIR